MISFINPLFQTLRLSLISLQFENLLAYDNALDNAPITGDYEDRILLAANEAEA
jgi:hypothetical protein